MGLKSDFLGTYDGIPSNGTTMVWTTNDASSKYYHPLNKYGNAYWLVDLMMDCERTDNGWFSIKASILTINNGEPGTWENDIIGQGQCRGTASAVTPSNIGPNHAGLCGYVNVFKYDNNDCEIDSIS